MSHRWLRTLKLAVPVVFLVVTPAFSQVVLTADDQVDAYTRVKSVLGASPETPDCSHPTFGPHITQTIDNDLSKYVFLFNIHVTPDNDRCSAFDRQRLEIKTEGSSPAYVKGFLNDSVAFRWKFKLPAGFQPSTSFTHIHQIKAYDGDASAPIMTLTPRKGSPNSLQLIHINSSGVTTQLTQTDLAPFVGVWVEAYEKITYNTHGTYSLVINRLSDGAQLFSYANNDLDLWRNGTTVVRPKWGIYRSLNHPEQLRDEQVEYDRFCLAKATDDCVSDQTLPDLAVKTEAFLGGKTVVGRDALYGVTVTSLRGLTADVNLSVTGLPAGATASFSQPTLHGGSGYSVLKVSTSGAMPAGVYPLVISAVSGVLSHVSQPTLTVSDFSLTVSPSSGTVQAGGALTYAATITPLAGFDEGVVLYVKGLPSGTYAYFAPPLVSNGSGGSTLHVYTTRWTPPGTYALEVSASNWWLTHTQASTLVVTGP